jgi:hypothetical protein
LQPERIFSAPSLSEVINQLLIYCPTGVLTIWRAVSPRQEEATLAIQQGRPVYIVWRATRENANDAMLTWFNSWGEICFTFSPADVRLPLPAPGSGSRWEQATGPLPKTTTPLPAIPSLKSLQRALKLRQGIHTHEAQGQANNHAQGQHTDGRAASTDYIATLTAHGQIYPAAKLPRYDRTIFLLINGRRTLQDLAQLTKRPREEVYATLRRLLSLQLISIRP